MFLGLVPLGSTIISSQLTVIPRNLANGGTPKDADSGPTYRIYGIGGIMANGTGSLGFQDPSASGGTITNATNVSPIVITSANHGLSTGTRVTVANVLGNTAANGDWQITKIDANTFSLNGSTGNAAYTSGGTWHTTGVYAINFTPLAANGFNGGQCYAMLVTWLMSGVVQAEMHTFTVT